LLEQLLSKEVADISTQLPQSVEELRKALEDKDKIIEEQGRRLEDKEKENQAQARRIKELEDLLASTQ